MQINNTFYFILYYYGSNHRFLFLALILGTVHDWRHARMKYWPLSTAPDSDQ